MIQTSGIISMERERGDHLHWSYNLSVNEYLTPKANKFKAYNKNTIDVTGIFITKVWHNSQLPVNFLLLILNIAWHDLNFKKHDYETTSNTVCSYNTTTNDVSDIFILQSLFF